MAGHETRCIHFQRICPRSIFDIAVSLPLLNIDQLRSLTAEQVAWFRVGTLNSVLENLRFPKDGAKLKGELVNKLLEYLHPFFLVDHTFTHSHTHTSDAKRIVLSSIIIS
jgi:hypothetical protein